MSHVIPISKVNQFLPHNKLELDETISAQTGLPVDHDKIADLEETARAIVLGQLQVRYDTTGWLAPTAPNQPVGPGLVLSATGMLVAGWVYDRQFSEEAIEGSSYGARKVREAYALLSGILSGTYDIGEEILVDPAGEPSVFVSDPVFTMNMRP